MLYAMVIFWRELNCGKIYSNKAPSFKSLVQKFYVAITNWLTVTEYGN